jgi:hypothetical protein
MSFDVQKWFDEVMAQDRAEYRAKKKIAMKEFDTFRDAVVYLRREYGRNWVEFDNLCDVKVAGMIVYVSYGLRVDPITDEQYALVRKVSSRSKSSWNMRLS